MSSPPDEDIISISNNIISINNNFVRKFEKFNLKQMFKVMKETKYC